MADHEIDSNIASAAEPHGNAALHFTKMQGIGNDFVVVDGRFATYTDWSALALELCDRNTGVGADGLLVLDVTTIADVMMRMYNPDGTPDVCGNGLRCVARYAIDRGIVAGDTLTIVTLAGIRTASAVRGEDGIIASITVGMGAPRFDPPSVPVRIGAAEMVDYALDLGGGKSFVVSALSTGTTHSVALVDELPDDETFFTVSPLVECHPLFPDRTSLMWCKPEGDNRLSLRVWERGAGETFGCGTGACASAVNAIRHGLADSSRPVRVRSKGGELEIRWIEGQEIEMSGPAEYVFEGVFPLGTTA
jgi:diaminopimelate epimerase